MLENLHDPEETDDDSYALLARYRTGDTRALGTLIERYYPRVTRMVRVRLGDFLRAREAVEDVVQDVFLRIITGVERYERRSEAHWINWVATLVKNEISNHARRERTQKRDQALARVIRIHAESTAGDIPAESTSVTTKASRQEMEELVDRALSELTEPHREVILLRDYAGMKWNAIAPMLERSSPEACQELHRRAKRQLARRLPRPEE